MRLRIMKKIIEDSISKLGYSIQSVPGGIRIDNYIYAMNTLEELSRFNFLKTEIEAIKLISNVYYSRLPYVVIEQGIFNNFDALMERVKMKCATVIDAISEVLPKQNENSISIKIPEIRGIDELTKIVKDLDTILSQSLINEYFDAKVEVQNFDTGSNWIEIVVGTGLALNFVAGLAWSAAVIRKKLIEGDLMKQKVRSLEIGNEALNAIEQGLEKEIEILCDSEAKQLLLENNISDPKPEYTQRVKHSIKLLANLISKGAEIHPALNTPEESKNLFPDFAKLPNIQSKIKELPKSE